MNFNAPFSENRILNSVKIKSIYPHARPIKQVVTQGLV